ncbi:7715_t:CDS:2, partial [Funneliformis mosseae]
MVTGFIPGHSMAFRRLGEMIFKEIHKVNRYHAFKDSLITTNGDVDD